MKRTEKNGECFFHENLGKDLRLISFGYNDFSTLRAFRLFRKGEEHALHLVLGGKGTLVLGEKKWRVEEKQVFVLPADTLCKYYPDESDPWAYVWFAFKGDVADSLLARAGFSVETPVRTCTNFSSIENEVYEQIAELTNGKNCYESLLGLLYTVFGLFSGVAAVQTHKPPNALVFQMKKHVETYYVDPDFNVRLLCKMLYLSDAYASRLFKRNEGVTIKHYIMQTRLNAASALLTQGNCTVKEVAKKCGYRDYAHFVKEFKKFTGRTASEYRNDATDNVNG